MSLPLLLMMGIQSFAGPTADGGRSILVVVPSRDCRVVADGETIAIDALTTRATEWRMQGASVRFRPDRFAAYECVDAARRALTASDIRIDYAGNEAVRDTGGDR